MLVLTRKKDEKICIGENITITVVRIKGGSTVQIGIEAPDGVQILRGEVADRRKDDGTQAPPKSSRQTTTATTPMTVPPRSDSLPASEGSPQRQPNTRAPRWQTSRCTSFPVQRIAAGGGSEPGSNVRLVRVRAVVIRA